MEDRTQVLLNRLLGWLREDALPLWEHHGVDRRLGGYFETLAPLPNEVTGTFAIDARGAVRRGRVVARQIFVFDAGRRLGWQAAGPDPVRHGCEFLFSRMRRGDGLFHTAVDSETGTALGTFDLYEFAFYLFALARMHGRLSPDYPIHQTARTCLQLLRQGWGKSIGGFEETRPPSMPLKSNPHMHLFEAALAWIDATEHVPTESSTWSQLAEELCDLCLTRFIVPRSGAVHEFFDDSWRPLPDERGRIVEPGHQFEWSWLLMQWSERRHCPERQRQNCRQAAGELIRLAESHGVDPVRGVAFNELWDDMTPKDPAAKLWPQTERVKAWCAMMKRAQSVQEKATASLGLDRAARGLMSYLEFEPAGLWHEVMRPDGTFTREACKASSFYHIVCAIETLHECAAAAPEAT